VISLIEKTTFWFKNQNIMVGYYDGQDYIEAKNVKRLILMLVDKVNFLTEEINKLKEVKDAPTA